MATAAESFSFASAPAGFTNSATITGFTNSVGSGAWHWRHFRSAKTGRGYFPLVETGARRPSFEMTATVTTAPLAAQSFAQAFVGLASSAPGGQGTGLYDNAYLIGMNWIVDTDQTAVKYGFPVWFNNAAVGGAQMTPTYSLQNGHDWTSLGSAQTISCYVDSENYVAMRVGSTVRRCPTQIPFSVTRAWTHFVIGTPYASSGTAGADDSGEWFDVSMDSLTINAWDPYTSFGGVSY